MQLESRDVQMSADLERGGFLAFFDRRYLEMPSLRPVKVRAGYRFSCTLTVDDLTYCVTFAASKTRRRHGEASEDTRDIPAPVMNNRLRLRARMSTIRANIIAC